MEIFLPNHYLHSFAGANPTRSTLQQTKDFFPLFFVNKYEVFCEDCWCWKNGCSRAILPSLKEKKEDPLSISRQICARQSRLKRILQLDIDVMPVVAWNFLRQMRQAGLRGFILNCQIGFVGLAFPIALVGGKR